MICLLTHCWLTSECHYRPLCTGWHKALGLRILQKCSEFHIKVSLLHVLWNKPKMFHCLVRISSFKLYTESLMHTIEHICLKMTTSLLYSFLYTVSQMLFKPREIYNFNFSFQGNIAFHLDASKADMGKHHDDTWMREEGGRRTWLNVTWIKL